MNPKDVRWRTIRETRHGRVIERGSEPRRSGWAGALHRRSAHRMLEGSLRLAVVIEAKLVHRGVADGPGMADVPLLESLVGNGSESGHVRPRTLKLRKL